MVIYFRLLLTLIEKYFILAMQVKLAFTKPTRRTAAIDKRYFHFKVNANTRVARLSDRRGGCLGGHVNCSGFFVPGRHNIFSQKNQGVLV